MNTKYFLLFIGYLLFFSIDSKAQIAVKLSYNKKWEISKENDAIYYRNCLWDTLKSKYIGEFKDFNKSNQIISQGAYNSEGEMNGIFKYYFSNGNIKCQGKFNKNQIDSIWTWYYSNGIIQQKIVFNNQNFEIIEYNDSLGHNLIDSTNFHWSTYFINNIDSPPLKIEGNYINMKKDGKWFMYQSKNEIGYDLYKKGKYKKTILKNAAIREMKLIDNTIFIPFSTYATHKIIVSKNITQDDYSFLLFLPKYEEVNGLGLIGDSTIFKVDSKPKYIGGMEAIKKSIAMTIKYPFELRRLNKSGRVYLELIINEYGKIVERKVMSSPDELLSKAAINSTLNLDDFKPAFLNGKAIRSKIYIPITFEIPRIFK